MRRVLAAFVLLVGLLGVRPAEAASDIRPGDAMYSRDAACTLGFVVRGYKQGVFHRTATATYFLTAAHCVERTGDDVELEDGRVFGDVARQGPKAELPPVADDWALIKVRSAYVKYIRFGVRGVSGAPDGIATTSETKKYDRLRFSGHGVPWFFAGATRENRYGVLTGQSRWIYKADAMDTWGDSGGPVVHVASNQALGLVSQLCADACTSTGPTVQGILVRAAAKGYRVKLALA